MLSLLARLSLESNNISNKQPNEYNDMYFHLSANILDKTNTSKAYTVLNLIELVRKCVVLRVRDKICSSVNIIDLV